LVSHTKGRTCVKVFENRVPRTIFGPKRDEVTGRLQKRDEKCIQNVGRKT